MITVPVKSKLLQSASFDARRRELQVQFANGSRKTYCRVSRMTFLQLVRARSVGRFYRRVIMGKYAQVSESRKVCAGRPAVKSSRHGGKDHRPVFSNVPRSLIVPTPAKREARPRNFRLERPIND